MARVTADVRSAAYALLSHLVEVGMMDEAGDVEELLLELGILEEAFDGDT